METFQYGACLKPTDLCFNEENKCRGYYDSNYNYKIICDTAVCDQLKQFHCGLDYCSTNKSTCDEFLNLRFLIKSMTRLNLDKSRMQKYSGFFDTISKCASTSEYVLKPNEICLNGVNCYSKQKLPLRYDNVQVIKKIDCVCTGDYSYQCGKDFCALNKFACNALRQLKELNDMAEFISCNNSNSYFNGEFNF